MRNLPRFTGALLAALTADLEVGGSRTVQNSASYMPLHIDRLSERQFSLAHYYTQNGDRVCDPDGVFLRTDGGWLPVSLQLCTGHYTEAVQLDAKDQPIGYRPQALRDLTGFAVMWLRNICQQQGGLARIRQNITA